MSNQVDINKFKQDLNKTENLHDFLEVCAKYYDLKNAKIGAIVRSTLIVNIPKAIQMCNAKPLEQKPIERVVEKEDLVKEPVGKVDEEKSMLQKAKEIFTKKD